MDSKRVVSGPGESICNSVPLANSLGAHRGAGTDPGIAVAQFEIFTINEKVLLKLGSAFDVVGERRQLDFRVDTSRKTMTEEIEVRLRNQKRERVEVLVKENLYRWVNWTISSKSHDYRKDDAHDRLSGQHCRRRGSRGALHGAVQLVGALSPLAVRAWRAPVSEALTVGRGPPPRGSSKLLILRDFADRSNPCFGRESRREPVDRADSGWIAAARYRAACARGEPTRSAPLTRAALQSG